MSDLDQFACAALTGLLASESSEGLRASFEDAAKEAYDQAEAVLREREKRLSGPEREQLERLYREHMGHVVKGENLWPETVGDSSDGITVTPVAECLEVCRDRVPLGIIVRHVNAWHAYRLGNGVLARVLISDARQWAIDAVAGKTELDASD